MAARLTTYIVVGIVAATLIAGLIVGAQRDDYDGPVDLIVHNGRVFTADRSGTIAEAIAVRGNQVLRVGSDRDINRLRRPQTVVVDANGGAVLPGFNDSHVHFLTGGLALGGVDLSHAATLEDIQSHIAQWLEEHPDEAWVTGRGWTFAAFAEGLPTRQMLDEIVAERPVFLLSADGGAAWVNSRTLAMAGITRRTPDPPYGAIVRDPRTGEATGALKGDAIRLATALFLEPSIQDLGRALRLATAEAHRNGITSIHDAGTSGPRRSVEDFEFYQDALKDGDLKVRIHSAVRVAGVPLTEGDLDRLDAIRAKYPDDPVFKLGALKIWLDGTIDAQTAAMLSPSSRSTAAGAEMIAPDDLNRMVRLADGRGWQIMIHAAGDKAVSMALDAFQHAGRSNLAPARPRRHRIEHADSIDPGDIRRFGALGVIASMQPMRFAGHERARALGADRAPRLSQYRSITAGGGRLTFGSDWPNGSLNPLLGIEAAVTRTAPDGKSVGGWTTSERLTLRAALEAYTSVPAWASLDEQRKGSLTPGMLADIVVLDSDIFEMPPSELASAAVDVTIFDGKIVYRRGAPASSTTN